MRALLEAIHANPDLKAQVEAATGIEVPLTCRQEQRLAQRPSCLRVFFSVIF